MGTHNEGNSTSLSSLGGGLLLVHNLHYTACLLYSLVH